MSFYIFGYGSLIWNPGFEYIDRIPARLLNYERSLCMWSISLRGTPENPGLVLGLTKNPNSFCDGIVYKVDTTLYDTVISYLIQRENTPYECYDVLWLPITIENVICYALCFVSKPDHPQYASNLTDNEIHNILCTAHGTNGTSFDYLEQTILALEKVNIYDESLYNIYQSVMNCNISIRQHT